MRAIFRATAILGSASVVSILVGLVSAKVGAVLLGPAGFGRFAVLQTLVTFGTLIANLGVSVGLVRLVSEALGHDRPDEAFRLHRAAWTICGITGAIAAVLLVLLRRPLSGSLFGDAAGAAALVIIAPAIPLSLANAIQSGMLNAHQRVGDLARVQIGTALVALVPTVALIALLRERGIAPAVLAASLAGWAVCFYFYRRLPAVRPEAAQAEAGDAQARPAKALLRFGIPYMASMVFGAGVLMIMPLVILKALGPAEVGLYRAATSISVNYLSVLLAAMSQDYFPRVSRAAREPEALVGLINDQVRLILLVGGPVILAMIGLVPVLIPILFSGRFTGAVDLLEWQLLGDLFKFPLWAMSYVIMARLHPRAFFLTELLGGSMLLVLSWFAMQRWGLTGLGVAFLVNAFLMFLVEWAILRVRIGLRWTRDNALLLAALVAAMALVIALPPLGAAFWRMPVALALAAVAGGFTTRVLWREFGGWEGLRAWRKPRGAALNPTGEC
ncbi:MAG: oligosaccharide flippase family protein [Alphaproteobacteria bacterium]|nr:oligosaccharide flippase family protein [Alphaproteobacteria bacterium]MBV9372927.1 oligosaccharide flippase family protein [Alphaproteobacteria bacterium]MBV9900954.1 oligosaccharide flippase family protein [Alphaproteobacteria bacterium]